MFCLGRAAFQECQKVAWWGIMVSSEYRVARSLGIGYGGMLGFDGVYLFFDRFHNIVLS